MNRNFFDSLPIKEIEVPDNQMFFDVSLREILPISRNYTFTSYIKPPLITFRVPLDESIMSFDKWITRNNLEIPFCGIKREIDPSRLAGILYNNVIDPLHIPAYFSREGAKIDITLINGDIYRCIQLDTWTWITKKGKKVALICDFPGFNGEIHIASAVSDEKGLECSIKSINAYISDEEWIEYLNRAYDESIKRNIDAPKRSGYSPTYVKDPCEHKFEWYEGLTQKYEYCVKCDEKKKEENK